jgi:hypothetical protein
MKTWSRRSFLSRGTGLAVGVGFPRLWAASGTSRKKVIWLWMDGGVCPGHTWDPKAGQPCVANPIDTSVPGIQISEFLPRCAAQMHRLSIVRTVSHGLGHHELATGVMHGLDVMASPSDVPPVGTILSYELGARSHPMPQHLSMGAPTLRESRIFGDEFCPFLVGAWPNPIPNVRRVVAVERDESREALLLEQNREWDAVHRQAEIDRLEHAYVRSGALMTASVLRAFNILEEPADLRQEYGDGFGQQCLVARRLVQAGCPIVEIGLRGWSCHGPRSSAYQKQISTLDVGLATLIKDLDQKGLLEDTLVVCASEFGRPPQGEPWPGPFSVVLAGGFLRGGVVVGDTGRNGRGGTPPIPVKDLMATIYAACGVDWEKEYRTESGRKKTYALGGRPLIDLF